MVLLSDPDLLRKVLIKDSHVFINRRPVEGLTGPIKHGLSIMKDDKWKNARAIVSPAFSTAKLKTLSCRLDRVASAPYELGGYQLPKGTVINVPVYSLHHDPNVWPDPEKFIPERFLPEEKAKRHPMAFLPFGDGPRNCIGMRFALLEAKIAIAKAIRVIEIQSCEKTEIPLILTKTTMLSPQNGVWLRVARRSA
ncbi:unnamed protein product [Adineta steineri]|uniref:Cytochrome P450 n=1 Tax=Adineta steineri TaxID=433720 RepID=A0A819M2D7_9BILA|nr:unnamed protein product [Adineta steineri]CAF3972613.1 unnamed protein product [Adineta steineri]